MKKNAPRLPQVDARPPSAPSRGTHEAPPGRFFWLQQYRCPMRTAQEWQPLAGDASLRRFYRVRLTRGLSVVVSRFPDRDTLWNQLAVYAYLRRIAWPVPVIYAWDPDPPQIWMEDAGSLTLAHAWALLPALRLLDLYERLIDAWSDLQALEPVLPAHHPIRCRRLDWQRLRYELAFFHRHFLGTYLHLRLTGWDTHRLQMSYDRLARILDAMPQAVCHRDYHSRNVLPTCDGMRIVDYQDMQMGPRPYDIVSLLRDAYVRLPGQWVEILQARARERLAWTDDMWQLVALQRHLKALGTFGYQICVRRNRIYVPAVHRTLEYLLDAGELDAFRGLRRFRSLFEDARERGHLAGFDSRRRST